MRVRIRLKLFCATTFILFVSFNSCIWFWPNFGVFLATFSLTWRTIIFCASFYYNFCSWPKSWLFCGPNGLFGINVVEQLSFSMIISILTFKFDLILGSFFTFMGPWLAIFGVGVGSKNYFWVYSYSWITIIFYHSFNCDFWFLILR